MNTLKKVYICILAVTALYVSQKTFVYDYGEVLTSNTAEVLSTIDSFQEDLWNKIINNR